MAKFKKKKGGKIETTDKSLKKKKINIRIPTAPPTQTFKDIKKYNRKRDKRVKYNEW